MKRKSWGLSKKILLGCTFLILLPMLTMGILFYSSSNQIMEDQLLKQNLDHVRSFDEYYLTLFNDNLEFFLNLWSEDQQIVNVFEDSEIRSQYQNEWSKALLGYPEILSIYLGTEQGEMIQVPNSIPKDFDPRIRPWYIEAMNSDEDIVWTKPYMDIATTQLIFTVAKKYRDVNGKCIGVIGIDISLTEMSTQLSAAKHGENGYMILVNQLGEVIAGPPDWTFGTSIEGLDWSSVIMVNNSGSAFFEIDQKPVVISYVTNPITNWKLIGVMPRTDLLPALGPIRNMFTKVLIALSLWMILTVLGTLYYSDKKIVKPLQNLMNIMKRAENGDMIYDEKLDIRSSDEIGELYYSFSNMLKGQRDMLVQLMVTSVKLKESSNHTSAISRISNENAQSQTFAMKDLSTAIGEVSLAVNEVMNSINHIAEGIDEITYAMQDMGGTASDVTQSSVETSEAVSEVLGSLRRLEGSIESINESVKAANEKGSEAVTVVLNGKQVVDATKLEMDKVNQNIEVLASTIADLGISAGKIGDILEVVEDLTEQTNLLSLNASIEAARAGEHGKGFAVVASAIGRLSEKSKASTKDIEKLIRKIQKDINETVLNTSKTVSQIERGYQHVIDTEEAFNSVQVYMLDSIDQVSQIAEATERQLDSSKSIMQSTMLVNELAMQVSAASQEQLATIEELINTTDSVNSVMQEVVRNGNIQAANSEQIVSTGECLSEMTEEVSKMSGEVELISNGLNEQIENLVELVSKFKL